MKLSKIENADPNITVGGVIKWSLIAIFAGTVIWIGGAWIGVFGTVATTPAAIINRTLQPENIIANYEWFKRQYQDVNAITDKLANARNAQESFERSAGDRSGWSFEDKQEWNRLNTIALGLKNQRASMIAEYNARTQMANRDLFRTSDLPAEIPLGVE